MKASRRELRSFGLVVGAAFGVLAILQYVLKGAIPPAPLAGVSVVLVGLGLGAPAALRPVHFIWMKFALALGFVMNRVILAVIFFVLITAVALVQRVIGRDRLYRKFTPLARRERSESLWVMRKVTDPTPESYERQF